MPVEGELGEGKWTGPICLFLVTPPSVVPPALTCRPSRRPTRRRTACPGGLLSIPVMWVTWWPHPCGPRGLNQIFRKPGIKYSETTEKKDSPPPFITRAKPVPPLDVGPRCPWAHRSPSLGRNGKHVSQTCHVERPMCDRVAVRRRLNHVARRYVGRGPRGSEETSLTSKCQLRGPS